MTQLKTPEDKWLLGVLTDHVDPEDPENDPAVQSLLSVLRDDLGVDVEFKDMIFVEHEGHTYIYKEKEEVKDV